MPAATDASKKSCRPLSAPPRLAGPLALLGAVAGWFGAGLAHQGLGQRAFCAMGVVFSSAWLSARLGEDGPPSPAS